MPREAGLVWLPEGHWTPSLWGAPHQAVPPRKEQDWGGGWLSQDSNCVRGNTRIELRLYTWPYSIHFIGEALLTV